MVLDARIKSVRDAFKIVDLDDWSAIEPAQILGVKGVGTVTLNHIRMYLDQHSIRLRNDTAPDAWRKNQGRFRLGAPLGIDDVRETCPFTVAIDNREQLPYQFQAIKCDAAKAKRPMIVPTRFQTLQTGDYSIVGMEHLYAIERKSKSDLYGTLSGGRERFERELERMAAMHHADIVIEASLLELITKPPERSSVPPKAINRSIIAWSQRYPTIHWWMCEGRIAGEQMAFRLLERFYQDYTEATKQLSRHEANGRNKLDGANHTSTSRP